jgi:hypothetical protein
MFRHVCAIFMSGFSYNYSNVYFEQIFHVNRVDPQVLYTIYSIYLIIYRSIYILYTIMCKQGNKPSGSIKVGEFIDWMTISLTRRALLHTVRPFKKCLWSRAAFSLSRREQKANHAGKFSLEMFWRCRLLYENNIAPKDKYYMQA